MSTLWFFIKPAAAGLMLVVVPLIAGLAVGWWFASEIYEAEFFRTAAEVIPILLLALVVDMRYLTLDATSITGPRAKGLRDAIQAVGRFYLSVSAFLAAAVGVVIVVVGEIMALLVVAKGTPSGKWEQGFILAACFTALILVAARGIRVKKTPDQETGESTSLL